MYGVANKGMRALTFENDIYRAASKGIKVGDALVAVDMKACQVWFVCVCVCVCVCTKTEPLAHFAVSIYAYVSEQCKNT